jgi:hypothetical protein
MLGAEVYMPSPAKLQIEPTDAFPGPASLTESLMSARAQFICQSSACRRQGKIEIPAGLGGGKASNPKCTCGSEMKRVYSKPTVRELSKAEAMIRIGYSGFS